MVVLRQRPRCLEMDVAGKEAAPRRGKLPRVGEGATYQLYRIFLSSLTFVRDDQSIR
jgi:hypothetical protein